MKQNSFVIVLISIFVLVSKACGPLNPVNDFFGIQMNPDEETNFIIVDYSDVDGITYKNSVSMNPKINAWAEFSADDITIKVINNSDNSIPLNYTADQFILITKENEFYLGKGERAEYFKKGSISPNSSETFILGYPTENDNIANSGGNYSEQTMVTKDVLRNFSKTEGRLNVIKDNLEFMIVKLGEISIVLKKVPAK